MRVVFGVLCGIAGAMLVGAVLGAARGVPGLGLYISALLWLPILLVSLLGAGAGSALSREGIPWLFGLGFVTIAAAIVLVGGCLFFSVPRDGDDAFGGLALCILAGAGLAASAAGPSHKEREHP